VRWFRRNADPGLRELERALAGSPGDKLALGRFLRKRVRAGEVSNADFELLEAIGLFGDVEFPGPQGREGMVGRASREIAMRALESGRGSVEDPDSAAQLAFAAARFWVDNFWGAPNCPECGLEMEHDPGVWGMGGAIQEPPTWVCLNHGVEVVVPALPEHELRAVRRALWLTVTRVPRSPHMGYEDIPLARHEVEEIYPPSLLGMLTARAVFLALNVRNPGPRIAGYRWSQGESLEHLLDMARRLPPGHAPQFLPALQKHMVRWFQQEGRL
jgi:hypothetical protein